MKLTASNVHDTFMHCLFDDEECKDLKTNEAPLGAILVDGITMKVGFHPERLKREIENIKSMLSELPDTFMYDKGGGYSFLGACNTKYGTRWTGTQQIMQELFLLGQAIKCARPCLPKDLWSVLPGGVPYYAVSFNDFPLDLQVLQ